MILSSFENFLIWLKGVDNILKASAMSVNARSFTIGLPILPTKNKLKNKLKTTEKSIKSFQDVVRNIENSSYFLQSLLYDMFSNCRLKKRVLFHVTKPLRNFLCIHSISLKVWKLYWITSLIWTTCKIRKCLNDIVCLDQMSYQMLLLLQFQILNFFLNKKNYVYL